MTTVSNHSETDELSESNTSEIIDTNLDLYDKIKNAIAKLKATKQQPPRKRFAKFPCAVCDHNVNKDAIYCTNCLHWVHRKCNGTSKREYDRLSEEADDVPFYCLLYTIELNSQIFPLAYLDNSELQELNGVDLLSQLSLLVPYEIRSKLVNMPSLSDFDMDENLINTVNSKYYDITELKNVQKTNESFSILHTNLRSLSAHLDELHLLLCSSKMTFDVIGILETKEQVGKGFLTNVNLKGYAFYSQPSNSSAGGAGLYIRANLNYSVREDLNILEDEFECIWVEIKNAKSPNILCCCAYRHPNTDSRKFTEYMDMTMNKLSKENKLIFVMGDFNLNLFNCESHSETNDFVNCMVSHYLLPHILHPTRVTDHSATVIDNIFCNNTAYDTFSGNILCKISDHFPQFISS